VWQNPTGQIGNHLHQVYAGLPDYDPRLDQYQTWFRRYQPGLGRWMTPDALGGDITSPQSLNRYAYALNNPETLTDPLGLDPSDCRVNASGSVTCYGPDSTTVYGGAGGNCQMVTPGYVYCPGSSGGYWAMWGWNANCVTLGGCGPGSQTGVAGPASSPPAAKPPAPPPAKGETPACGTSGFGGGIGVAVGGNGDAGLGLAGATAGGFGGGGLFYDSSTGFSDGLFAEGAALAYAMTHVAATPSQSVQPGVLGAFAGGGASVFVTNARSVQQLSGFFTTYSLNIGLGPVKFSVQYAYAGSTKVLSIGPPYAGVSIGVSATRTTTNTVTQQRGCK
jgi:RHS repeat-associated protein